MDGVELDGRFINVKWCLSKVPNGMEARNEKQQRPRISRGSSRDTFCKERPKERLQRNVRHGTDITYNVKVLGLPGDTDWKCEFPRYYPKHWLPQDEANRHLTHVIVRAHTILMLSAGWHAIIQTIKHDDDTNKYV